MASIRILFVGDIVGNAGMDFTAMVLKSFIDKHAADFVIANGENAMEGKSISEAQLQRLYALGVHCVTSGNHIWERHHIYKILASDSRLLRPANYPPGSAGRGFCTYDLGALGKIAVANLQGRTYMFDIDCPFRCADWILSKLAGETKCIVVDMHAEATAEKIAMGWYLDGKVSAVLGTHTHVQTSDARILPQGTAYVTDVGMTGPFDSVVGLRKEIAIKRFLQQTPFKYESAGEDVHFSAVALTIDAVTGRAEKIETIFYPEFTHDGNAH